MFVNSRLKATKIIGWRSTFYRQRIPESSCARKETVDIGILVTCRNGDRKIMQSVRITSTRPDMTTVFHTWSYVRVIEIQSNLRRKKLHRTNQGLYYLGSSFSNRNNVRAPIQFRRKSQSQHLKRCFFHQNRPMLFKINSCSVFRLVKQN